jgi:hypothetical protein
MAATLVDYIGPAPLPDSYNGFRVKIHGLHTDTKPTNVKNGSGFYEMDTGDYYMFDEQNSQWRKQ